MAAETGHLPNRIFVDDAGALNLNGGNVYDCNNNTIAQQIVFTIAKGGTANICLVTMQVADGQGNAIAAVFEVEWWLSDAASGAGVTATTASGTVGAGADGTDLYSKISKKAGDALTNASGQYQLSITDTAKTGFYVCVGCPGTGVTFVTRQLQAADYD